MGFLVLSFLHYISINHPDSDNIRIAMAEKVKEVAMEEADRLKALTVEAARSAAYLYPLRVGCSLLPCFHPCSEIQLTLGTND